MSEYQYYEFRALDRPLTEDQQDKVAALARKHHLEALTPKESQVWDEVTGLIEERKTTPYKRAVTLLVDLRDLAIQQSNVESFGKRLAEIERAYSKSDHTTLAQSPVWKRWPRGEETRWCRGDRPVAPTNGDCRSVRIFCGSI